MSHSKIATAAVVSIVTIGAAVSICLIGLVGLPPSAVAFVGHRFAAQFDSANTAFRRLSPASGRPSPAASVEGGKDALKRLQESLEIRATWAKRFGAAEDEDETMDDDEDFLNLAAARAAERRWRIRLAEQALVTAAAHGEKRLADLQEDGKEELQTGRARLSLSTVLTRLGDFKNKYDDPAAAVLALRRASEVVLPLLGNNTEPRPSGETPAARVALARAEAALAGVLCAAGGGQGAAVAEAKSHFGAAAEAVQLARAAGEATHEPTSVQNLDVLDAQIHVELSVCQHNLGELSVAKATAEAARRLAEVAGASAPGQPRVVLQVIAAQGAMIHDEGKFAEALALYDEYLATAPTPVMGTEPSAVDPLFEVVQNKAFARMALGDTEGALALLDGLQSVQTEVSGILLRQDGQFLAPGSPSRRIWDSVARTHVVRAEVLLDRHARSAEAEGVPDAALASAVTAVAKLRKYPGSSPALFNALNTLGNVEEACRESAKASAAYNEALSLGTELFGRESVLIAAPLQNLGTVLSEGGQHVKALELFQHALQIEERTIGFANPDTSHTYRSIAIAYWHSGERSKAMEAAKKSAASARLCLLESNPQRKRAEQLLEQLAESAAQPSLPAAPRAPAALTGATANQRLAQLADSVREPPRAPAAAPSGVQTRSATSQRLAQLADAAREPPKVPSVAAPEVLTGKTASQRLAQLADAEREPPASFAATMPANPAADGTPHAFGISVDLRSASASLSAIVSV